MNVRPLLALITAGAALAGGRPEMAGAPGPPTTHRVAAPPPFGGTAFSATRCPDVLPAPRQVGGHFIYGPDLNLFAPLRLQGCWKGTVLGKMAGRGRSFTLAGYYDRADNLSAVLVQVGGQHALVAVPNGLPLLTLFTGTSVCYVPNPAKGLAYVLDLLRLGTEPDPRRTGAMCRPEQTAGATTVAGLKSSFPIGSGLHPR